MEPTDVQIQAMQAADRAKAVLDDPLVSQALADIESAVIDAWVTCDTENRTRAEDLKRLLWAAQQFKSIFDVLVAGGSITKNELLNAEHMQVRQEAARRRIYG